MPRLDGSDWTEKVTDAGLATERTEAEWVAHPTALDDLLRVLCGTSTKSINADRKRERAARAAASLVG